MSISSLEELYELLLNPSLLVLEGLVSGKPVKAKGKKESFFLCGTWSCLQKCDMSELSNLFKKIKDPKLREMAITVVGAFTFDKRFAKYGVDCHLGDEDDEGERKADVVMLNRIFRFLALRLVVEAKAGEEDLPKEVTRSIKENTDPDEYLGEKFKGWWKRIGKKRAIDKAFDTFAKRVGQHILDTDAGLRKRDMIELLGIDQAPLGTYTGGITFDFHSNFLLYKKFSSDVRDVFFSIKCDFECMEMATDEGRARAQRLAKEMPESFGDEPVRAAREAMLRSVNSTSLKEAEDFSLDDMVKVDYDVNFKRVPARKKTIGKVVGFGQGKKTVLIQPKLSEKVQVVDARQISKPLLYGGR